MGRKADPPHRPNDPHRRRRITCVVLLAGTVAVLAAGCGRQPPGSPDQHARSRQPASTASADAGPVPVHTLHVPTAPATALYELSDNRGLVPLNSQLLHVDQAPPQLVVLVSLGSCNTVNGFLATTSPATVHVTVYGTPPPSGLPCAAPDRSFVAAVPLHAPPGDRAVALGP